MSLTSRKVIVVSLMVGVFLAGNILVIAQWLSDRGVPEVAHWIRAEYLTGTAIAVIVVLLILLMKPRWAAPNTPRRRCPVCDHRLPGWGSYCAMCGSKISLAS